jgi:cytochrome b561
VAALVIAQFCVAFVLEDAPRGTPERALLFSWHATIAVSILALWPLRLIWRILHRPPALPYTVSKAQVFLARQTHYAMYALLLLMPLSGWVMVSSPDREILLIGGAVLPPLPGAELITSLLAAIGIENMGQLHGWLATALMVLVGLHLLAALLHHFVYRDEIVLRMAPSITHPLLHRLRGSRR